MDVIDLIHIIGKESVTILQDEDLMVKTVLPKDLGSMEGRCYIHAAMQLGWAAIGVEDAGKAEDVEMSML